MLETKMSEIQTENKRTSMGSNLDTYSSPSIRASPMQTQKFIFPQSQEYQMRFMKTALQRHCAFFDRDNDGVITLWDTFKSIRALGFNLLMSLL